MPPYVMASAIGLGAFDPALGHAKKKKMLWQPIPQYKPSEMVGTCLKPTGIMLVVRDLNSIWIYKYKTSRFSNIKSKGIAKC